MVLHKTSMRLWQWMYKARVDFCWVYHYKSFSRKQEDMYNTQLLRWTEYLIGKTVISLYSRRWPNHYNSRICDLVKSLVDLFVKVTQMSFLSAQSNSSFTRPETCESAVTTGMCNTLKPVLHFHIHLIIVTRTSQMLLDHAGKLGYHYVRGEYFGRSISALFIC